ncbi:MAG: hypothetical protein ABIF40_01235 [archaeon]
MIISLTGPQWFYGIGSGFEIILGFVAFLIAMLSLKAFKLSTDKKYYYFSFSFFLISLAYFLTGVSKFAMLTHVLNQLTAILQQFDFIFFLHVLLIIFAYMILLIITLKINRNKKAIGLLFGVSLLFVAFSYQYFLKFHLVLLLLLFFLALKYFENAADKKTINSGLVFTAFYFLMIGQVFALCVILMPGLVILGELFQLLGFLMLFGMFVKVLKHG